MCGGKPSKPKVVQTEDPAVTAQKAADEAAKKANEETAAARAKKQRSSLLSQAGAAGTVIEQGKRTLGA
ncbi:hypothetical protein H8F21_22190 [Pseudomonas sp. P66]|uniref:Uncharacterized protein n=1 Tax=Pseudomonas arcuscaelestis TaxID=2710591 RepID=A0ABS2C348_9PSED|nr:hypothetical protein [Pseudomonas arcuscaelestis]MBM5460278.1 hypothetical protein [Pseudomonas arcuscaelestis]